MAKTQILNYYIHLANKELVEQLQAQLLAQAGPGQMLLDPTTGKVGILRAPTGASGEFTATIQDEDEAFAVTASDGAIRSPWFVPDTNNFPRDVATFTRKSGGWFGLPILFGSTTRFYWVGHFVYAQPTDEVQDGDGAAIPVPAKIPQRKFFAGMELAGTGEGTADAAYTGPAGAIGIGGFGFARRHVGASTDVVEFSSWSPAPNRVWVRGYIEIKKMPGARVEILALEQTAQATHGLRIDLDSSGSLIFSERDSGSTITTYPAALEVGPRYKIDVCANFGGADGPPQVRTVKLSMWLNGTFIANVAHSNPLGAPTGINVATVEIGKHGGEVQTGEVNFDHWRVADIPEDKNPATAEFSDSGTYAVGDVVQVIPAALAGSGIHAFPADVEAWSCVQAYTATPSVPRTPGTNAAFWVRALHSKDWASGNRLVVVRPTGYNGENQWTGDYRRLLNRAPNSVDVVSVSTTTSAAILSVTTDIADVMKLPGALGITGFVVALYGSRGSSAGTIGYNLTGTQGVGGGAVATGNVMEAITQPTVGSQSYQTDEPTMYRPAAMAEPIIPTALTLRHVKGADTSIAHAFQLAAVVEVIGIFGPEDVLPPEDGTAPVVHEFPTPTIGGQHNADYPSSPWARSNTRAIAPVIVVGGTYVGDDIGTDLTFRVPVHWLWVRRVTGTTDTGWKWFSGMIAGHKDMDESVSGNAMSLAGVDPTFVPVGGEDDQAQRYRVRIVGNDAQINANGVTYQYIAVCDPGARLMLCGAFLKDDTTPAIPGTVALDDPEFLPLAGFFWSESRGLTTSNTLGYKGPGLAGANDGITLPGTSATDYVTFAAGQLTVESGLVASDPANIAYALIRQDDGSGGDVHKVFGLASWTGDGAASRTISFAPATGLRPLFAMVASVGGSGFWRDPSFTTTNSGNMGTGTQAATGITAGGIDSFTVGSSLNSNGVVYTAFVIWGSATAGNGGWSGNGEFTPLEPDTPGTEEPTVLEEPDDDGGDPDEDVALPDLDDDLDDAACVGPTTRVVNLALQRIGINKPIGTLATEQSPAAAAVRLVYDDVLQEVLCARPWPFATRYTNLTLDDGSEASPVNGDWIYAYDTPSNCLFPRRIVADRGSALNPTPPPMRVGGGVIFTNQEDAQLEHTARVSCPATAGDATFRSAWAWRLAAELAPSLTRLPDRATFCLQMYQATLAQADEFLRLGNPGHRPTADPTDLDADCLDVKLRVINRSLIRIGCRTLAALDEQSRESVAVAVVYEDELRAVLRDFPWAFATAYANPLTLVDGSVSDYATPDWVYSYRAPTDMLFARRLVRDLATIGVGRRFEREPAPFRTGADDTGGLIYSNEESAVLEYTVRQPIDKAEDLFLDAFSWRLAAAVAPSLSVQEPDAEEQAGRGPSKEAPRSEGGNVRRQAAREGRADYAMRMYYRTLAIARAGNANEQQQEPHDLQGDVDWISGR